MNVNGYIGRKMRLPTLKEKPAIIIAAFGSTNHAKDVLELFQTAVQEKYPEHDIYWAYTSEIIRKQLDLPGLQQTLGRVEADGYRKAVVQPLHIFPGTEYQQLAETCHFFPGLRVFPGESLLHRWEFIKEMMAVIEPELLVPEEGYNLLAIHGTPLAADPANTIYLGLDAMVTDLYPNVRAAAIEGVPDIDAILANFKRNDTAARYGRIKIIPVIYFAGLHAEQDLMGDERSWRTDLESLGFQVECATVTVSGKSRFKGLAYYPEVTRGFLQRLDRALTLSHYY